MSAPWRVTNLCCKNLIKTNISLTRVRVAQTGPVQSCYLGNLLQAPSRTLHVQVTCYAKGFLSKGVASDLWLSVTSVSNAGKKKGRGRAVGRKAGSDLNRGQQLGDGRGKYQISFPGLNAPLIERDRLPTAIYEKKADPDYQQKLIDLREQSNMIRYPAMPPLLRGYTGSRNVGMRLGPPDPIGDHTFEGFDSVLLESRFVSNMTGTLGRKHTYTALVVVGNGNGIIGWGYGTGSKQGMCITQAKNRAAQCLVYIPLFEGHTVYHDMFSQYHKSKLFIHQREKGYGLRCHRVLIAVCKMIGLKDLHVKVEGNTKNYRAITKGFIEALVDQEDHQQLADRTGYHVVEQRRETDMFPKVVASPSSGIVRKDSCREDSENITFDLSRMYLKGNTEYKRKEPNPFKKDPHFIKNNAIKHKQRNQAALVIQRKAGLM